MNGMVNQIFEFPETAGFQPDFICVGFALEHKVLLKVFLTEGLEPFDNSVESP
jgi:hypothetical protein